jgi:hypothetical protein
MPSKGNEARDLCSDAQGALERVCSGAGLDPPARYYSPRFVDHVNDLEFRGLNGAEDSIALYKGCFDDMKITVEEQVRDGARVASRFTFEGTSYGRRVRANGITISRFEDGLIVEDWSVTDTLALLRQLGVWRSVMLALRAWRMSRRASA